MTATAPVKDVSVIIERCSLREPVVLRSNQYRANLRLAVRPKGSEEVSFAGNFRVILHSQKDLGFVGERVCKGEDAIVYVRKRRSTAELFKFFRRNFPGLFGAQPVVSILHSSFSAAHVAHVIDQWKTGNIRLLITTSILSNVNLSYV